MNLSMNWFAALATVALRITLEVSQAVAQRRY
jgi:hypothetical protein